MLTVTIDATNGAAGAADRAMDAATEGRRQPDYFGLQGELVCVHLLTEEIPVINGPVPTDHPVLSFQTTGDTLWLWDPSPSRGEESARHALRVRAEDVALDSATGKSC